MFLSTDVRLTASTAESFPSISTQEMLRFLDIKCSPPPSFATIKTCISDVLGLKCGELYFGLLFDIGMVFKQ